MDDASRGSSEASFPLARRGSDSVGNGTGSGHGFLASSTTFRRGTILAPSLDMNRRSMVSKSLTALVAAFTAVALLPTSDAVAAEDQCSISDVDYAVVGRLQIKDTQFGAADGVYPLGSGKARVRFERGAKDAPATARLMSYELDNHLTVKASFAFWSTTVVTETHTKVETACEGASTGSVGQGGDVVWNTPVLGYRSDGTISCEGNVCGNFGAPAAGSAPLHEAPKMKFGPFHFSADGKTFQMPYTFVSHSDSPHQTSMLGLGGREIGRSCVTAPLACQ